MKLLKDKIKSEGIVLNDSILKVDSFLNHQIDPELMMAVGREFAERFKDEKIDKVFTIESSGIACALTTALCLHVPVVFARKQKSELMSSAAYTTKVYSFTKKVTSSLHHQGLQLYQKSYQRRKRAEKVFTRRRKRFDCRRLFSQRRSGARPCGYCASGRLQGCRHRHRD